ncbi:MAG: hypothetical protein JNM63_16945 [Spirochaetia bacterium]|nr:hypothetical protein [Spirochaetia bacterium]
MRTILFLGMAVLALFSCGPSLVQEKEPNNRFADAQSIPAFSRVEGKLSRNDVDLFRLQNKEGSFAQILLRSGGGRWSQLSLYDETRTALRSYKPEENGRDFSATFFFPPGVHFLRLENEGGREFLYTLSVKLEPAAGKSAEREPNDSLISATTLPQNQKLSGFYFPKDEDYFLLRNDSDEIKTVNLDLGEVSGIDAVMDVLDAQGEFLFRIDNGSVGEPEVCRHLKLDPRERVYIRLSCKERSQAIRKPFSIFNEIIPRDPSWEWEPNDAPHQASVWNADREEMHGLIDRPGDRDHYQLDLDYPEKKVLTLAASGAAKIPMKMELRDEMGNLLSTSKETGGAGVVIPNYPVQTGRYFLSVMFGREKSSVGKSYLIRKLSRDSSPGQEIEPNEDPAHPGELLIESPLLGYLPSSNDVDVFAVSLDWAGKYRLRFNRQSGAKVHFEFLKFDESILFESGDGDSVNVLQPLSEGKYFVRIRYAEGSRVVPGVPYQLSLRQE